MAMNVAGYFCGQGHKDASDYEPLATSSPDGPWEEESNRPQPRREARFMKIRKSILSLWSIAVIGTVVVVTALFVLIFVVQPYIAYALEPSALNTAHIFDDNKNASECAAQWVDDVSPFVTPVMCHSHNDYLRRRPLFSALAVGCASVEADVWLTDDGKDLLVGHHRIFLSKERTFRSLYINPLLEILDAMNKPTPDNQWGEGGLSGVFAAEPEKTLILLIDVKGGIPENTWPVILEQLQPLMDKGYVSRHEKMHSRTTNQTFWSGPITLVGTGGILSRRDLNIGPDLEGWRQYHNVFLDAPLSELTNEDFKAEENEFYTASMSFRNAFGLALSGLSRSQVKLIRKQIKAAKDLGLLSRYWDNPVWPILRRDYIWKVLVREDVGLLNADDVVTAATRRWSSGYIRESVWMCVTASYLLAYSLTLVWIGKRLIQRKLSSM